jgi:flagellar hook-associated protein 3 FlgL
MRIATSHFQQLALRGLQARLGDLARAQRESATGRRVHLASDDPVAAAEILRLESQAREADRHLRSGAAATTRMAAEDAVLDSARSLMQQARAALELASGAAPGDPAIDQALDQVRLIRQQLVALGNTRLGSDYLFGGGRSASPPFLADGTYVGDSIAREAEIDDGVRVPVNHTGDDFLTDAIDSLARIESRLAANDPAGLAAELPAFDAARDRLLETQAETGARLGRVQDAAAGLGRRLAALLDRRDAVRDVDPTEASVRLISAQAALERAYAAVGRVLQADLLQYLR